MNNAIKEIATPIATERTIPKELWDRVVSSLDVSIGTVQIISPTQIVFSYEGQSEESLNVIQYIPQMGKVWASLDPHLHEALGVCENYSLDDEGLRTLLVLTLQGSASLKIMLWRAACRTALEAKQPKPERPTTDNVHPCAGYPKFVPLDPELEKRRRIKTALKVGGGALTVTALAGIAYLMLSE